MGRLSRASGNTAGSAAVNRRSSRAGIVGIRVGTAGWGNPAAQRIVRPPEYSHLEHYSTYFNCAELNSSFYQLHHRSTYRRWAAATGRNFRFSVKIPRIISHDSALRSCEDELDRFLDGVRGLNTKLALLLLQLPPRLEWHASVAQRFFRLLRNRIDTPVVCEPRHSSWSGASVERLLSELGISLVCSDPLRLPRSWTTPGGVRYYRLHGSPRVYWSSYSDRYLHELAWRIAEERKCFSAVWCIFDNTAAGHAWENAQTLNAKLLSAIM